MDWKNAGKNTLQILTGLLLTGGAVYYCFHVEHSDLNRMKRPAGEAVVCVEKAAVSLMDDAIEGLGTAVARESADITANVTEKVVEINFNDGDFVEKGKLLVRLDDAQEQAEKKQAEINIAEQKREMERVKTMFLGRAVSQKSFDEQKTSLARSEMALAVVKAQIADRQIRAPFTGRLGVRMVSMGDLVQPNMKVTTLDDITKLYVDFSVPEKYFAKLKPGSKIGITNAAYPGRTFEGTVKLLLPRIDSDTRSVIVRGVVPNPKAELRPGMMFNVEVAMGRRKAVRIPEKAVMTLGELKYIFIVGKDRGATRRDVTTGRRKDGKVEITSNLAPGEIFVSEGVSKLVSGMKVTIASAGRKS